MGGPVIDPTKNVLDLTFAANKRQDDLREMHNRYLEAKLATVSETVKWLEKLSDVHQRHDREIHTMEQAKLAAFRQSDEAARITEAERTLAAVQLVARSAETTANDIRAVLNTTAQTLASANAARDLEFNNRISALEKSSYEGAGKGTGARNTVTYAMIALAAVGTLITIGSVVVAIAFAIRR
jgi:hypothetical protein